MRMRHVEVLADEVDEARGQVHLERDRRIALDEFGEQRREHQVGQVVGHGHPQPAAGLGLPILRQRRGRLDVVDDVMRMREHAWPKSVTVSLRVVRSSRRSPSCASSAATRRDTVDLGRPRRSAARLKLPSSTTRAKRRRSLGSRSWRHAIVPLEEQ